MYKIAALIGEAGSGKDTLLRRILSRDTTLHKVINCTTRPRREGEIDGINYFFYTPKQFADKILNNEMLEMASFNDWFYGTSFDSLREDCVNVGVFNLSGIKFLLARDDIELKIYYVSAAPKTRLLRQLNRENKPDVDEIVRRYGADSADFKSLKYLNYTTILNEDVQDLDEGADYIIDSIQTWCGSQGKDDQRF